MITRFYSDLGSLLQPQRVLIIYGPRRVGKTTLLKQFLATTSFRYKLDTGDNIRTQQVLSSQNLPLLREYAEGYDLLALDEAAQIPNIGMGLKLIVDNLPNIRVIATGSSSFDLSHQIGEPLTGRKRTLTLYPIAQLELLSQHNRYELKEKLEEFLIFGSYPEVVTARTKKEKITILQELVDSYVFKDILTLERVKGTKILLDLLKLLAFQIGNQVSLNELSIQLGIDVKTVGRYLDLLEKTFIITRLGGFSRNLRSEITSKSKYFFLDNGVRNAVIAQFNPLDSRNDTGQLFENFIIMERTKKRSYKGIYGTAYFWRTHQQQEIDLIEERDGKLFAYECKWSVKKKVVAPKEWISIYPNATFAVITAQTYLDFIT